MFCVKVIRLSIHLCMFSKRKQHVCFGNLLSKCNKLHRFYISQCHESFFSPSLPNTWLRSDKIKSHPAFLSCWKSHFTWKMSHHRGKMCWLFMFAWKSQNQAWHLCFFCVAGIILLRSCCQLWTGKNICGFLEPPSHGICSVNQIDDKVMLVYFGGQNVSSHNR